MQERVPAPAGAPGRPRLVLASASPRRRDLLAGAGFAFAVEAAEIEERAQPGEAPAALVERLAHEKAAAVARRQRADAPPAVVLGSDTVVVLGGEVLGKPHDPEHAVALLRRLVGRTHRVLTGVAVVAGAHERRLHVESRVTMHAVDEARLRAYVATGEPLDKAGAYALQGEGRRLVARVEGSETNVIGLPVEETRALLAQLGVRPETGR